VPSTHRATLDENHCLRGVFDAPTVETLARSAPANDLDGILNARLGLGDERMRWFSEAWDDRNRG
jgi:hypothetical protein